MYPEFDWTWFEEIHKDETGGKFERGDIVKYASTENEWNYHYVGRTFKVLAVNVQGEGEVEYLLEGFPFLVWEEELKEITE